MADYDSSLPVRSEADGADERLQSKLVDFTTPTQGMEVDTDGNAHVEVHGDNPAAGDEVLRLSELGAPNGDGDYDVTNNTKPASTGLIGHDRATTPADTGQNERITAIQGTDDDTVHALDVAIHDGNGDAYTISNPLPVFPTDDPGTEELDYQTTASVASDASTNHDYSIADTDVFRFKKCYASASGKLKLEVQIGDGAVSEVFTSIFVGFNSTATPNIEFDLDGVPVSVTGTANTTTVRLILTNLDNQAQDVYSTLLGITN